MGPFIILKIRYVCVCMCVGAHNFTICCGCQRSEDNLDESVLPSTIWILGNELKSLDLPASSFTYLAIYISHQHIFSTNIILLLIIWKFHTL